MAKSKEKIEEQEYVEQTEDSPMAANPNVKSKSEINQEKLQKIFDEEKRIKEEWEDKLKDIKLVKNNAFFVAEQHIRMVGYGLSNGCVIVGKGGISKTHTILAILKEMNVPFERIDSYSSAVSFYASAYEGRKKILFLDDIDDWYKDKRLVSYLKAMTDTYKDRLVRNNVTRQPKDKYGEYVPDRFFFEGGVIIATNELKKDKHVKALLTRIKEIQLNLSYKQKMMIIEEIIQTEDEIFPQLTLSHRREVFNFIRENTDEQTYDLNFRTLKQMYGYYAYSLKINDPSMWVNLGKLLLKSGDSYYIIKELETNPAFTDLTREDKSKKYEEITGKSRATYFREYEKYISEMSDIQDKENTREIIEKLAKEETQKRQEQKDKGDNDAKTEQKPAFDAAN